MDYGTELVTVQVTSNLITVDSVVGDNFVSIKTHFFAIFRMVPNKHWSSLIDGEWWAKNIL
jgi:hypothetical protein